MNIDIFSNSVVNHSFKTESILVRLSMPSVAVGGSHGNFKMKNNNKSIVPLLNLHHLTCIFWVVVSCAFISYPFFCILWNSDKKQHSTELENVIMFSVHYVQCPFSGLQKQCLDCTECKNDCKLQRMWQTKMCIFKIETNTKRHKIPETHTGKIWLFMWICYHTRW